MLMLDGRWGDPCLWEAPQIGNSRAALSSRSIYICLNCGSVYAMCYTPWITSSCNRHDVAMKILAWQYAPKTVKAPILDLLRHCEFVLALHQSHDSAVNEIHVFGLRCCRETGHSDDVTQHGNHVACPGSQDDITDRYIEFLRSTDLLRIV